MTTKTAVKKPVKTLEQMESQAQEVRGALASALVNGDPTTKLREFLCELEAEIAADKQRIARQRDIDAKMSARNADQSATSAKSAAVLKFETEHPVAVRLVADAAERRARRSEAFTI